MPVPPQSHCFFAPPLVPLKQLVPDHCKGYHNLVISLQVVSRSADGGRANGDYYCLLAPRELSFFACSSLRISAAAEKKTA